VARGKRRQFLTVGRFSGNLLVGKIVNLANLGLKTTILGKLRNKIEILTTHDLLCWKFAVSLGKSNFLSPYFF